MDTNPSALVELQQLLKSSHPSCEQKAFVGFDGFIDKLKKPVKQKFSNVRTTYFDSIGEFADRIALARGKSGQVQMAIQGIKPGGNAPILCNTLGNLGIRSYCIGTMGYPHRHQVFSSMNALCEPISVLDPGLSDAIEFTDGKLIFSELEVFDQYNWSHIKKTVGLEKIMQLVCDSRLIAFVDWVNLPHASDIWEGMLEDVIKPTRRKDLFFLFDLCDPSKKTTEEIDEVLDLISDFSTYGKVTLGLNENETLKIYSVLKGIDFLLEREKLPSVEEAGRFLFKSMAIDSLLVHPVDRCIVYRQREMIEVPGRLVTQPKVQTGGGDNLNAGYCLGLLSGFTLAQSITLAIAASGSYIQNGVSPDRQALIDYLELWRSEIVDQPSVEMLHR